MQNMNVSSQEAVKKLCEDLKNDEGIYYAYQANIAVQFQDEMRRGGYEVDEQVHEISNTAAKNFLNLLISQSKN